jgi:LPXTG-motif cell wall-anchored protein
LADVSESDEDGQILWDALLRDSYLVLEVKAPAGYKLPDFEGELVYRSSAVGLVKELTVVNYSGYELPETGGVGTGIFTILGLGLTGISGILGILTRRRKKR